MVQVLSIWYSESLKSLCNLLCCSHTELRSVGGAGARAHISTRAVSKRFTFRSPGEETRKERVPAGPSVAAPLSSLPFYDSNFLKDTRASGKSSEPLIYSAAAAAVGKTGESRPINKGGPRDSSFAWAYERITFSVVLDSSRTRRHRKLADLTQYGARCNWYFFGLYFANLFRDK